MAVTDLSASRSLVSSQQLNKHKSRGTVVGTNKLTTYALSPKRDTLPGGSRVVTSRAAKGGPNASMRVASVPFTGTIAETRAGPPARAMVMPTPAEEPVKEPSQ